MDNAIVKKRTGTDKLVAVLASKGRKFEAILGTSGTNRQATKAPTTPAIALMSRLSKTNNRTMLVRDAPIDIRNAISRRRPLKRTSKRLATLLHAMSKTKLTQPKRVMKQ